MDSLPIVRFILGGVLFGIGMTLSSGCGNKTLIRIGGGNLKSVFVFLVCGFFAYLMTQTPFYEYFFHFWISSLNIKLADFGYKSSDSKFHLGTGYQQYDDFYLAPSFSISYDKVETSNSASDNLKKQKGDYFTTNIEYGIDYDKRNQKYQPSSGFRHRFNQIIPVYSKELAFRNTYKYNKYFELNENLVSGISFYASAITALDSAEDVRISQRLWVPNSLLRGFEPGRIGPIDGDDHVGGNYASALSFNTDLPIFQSWQEADIKYFCFIPKKRS